MSDNNLTHQSSGLNSMMQKAGLDKLEPREKRLLLGGSVFVVCFLIFQFVIEPFMGERHKLQQSIARKELDLTNIKVLQQEYRQLKEEEGGIQSRISARPAGFSLFTFIDRQAETSGVKKQITSMKPSTSEGDGSLNKASVEVKLQEISLEQLVGFLRLVESEENVVIVERLAVQESGKGQLGLDVVMRVSTFTMMSGQE